MRGDAEEQEIVEQYIYLYGSGEKRSRSSSRIGLRGGYRGVVIDSKHASQSISGRANAIATR